LMTCSYDVPARPGGEIADQRRFDVDPRLHARMLARSQSVLMAPGRLRSRRRRRRCCEPTAPFSPSADGQIEHSASAQRAAAPATEGDRPTIPALFRVGKKKFDSRSGAALCPGGA
jgi:hypothetical protein